MTLSEKHWLGVAAATGLAAGLLLTGAPSPTLSLALLVGLCGVAAILVRPELGLFLLAAMAYLTGIEMEAVAFVLLAIVIRWALQGGPPSDWWMPAVPIAPYVLVATGTLLVARDASLAHDHLVMLGKNAALAFVVFSLLERRATLRRLAWTLLLIAIVMGSVAVHQRLTGNWESTYWGLAQSPGSYEGEFRAVGPLGDANYFALILLVMLPLAVDRLRAEKRLPLKALSLWAALASVLSLVFTFSRGAVVGLAAMLLLMAALSPRRWSLLGGMLLAAALLSPLIPASYMDRLASLPLSAMNLRQEGTVTDAAVRGRLSENLVAMDMFLEHPLLGVGYANYPVRYQEYAHRIGLDTREGRTPHNLYLQVAAESGLVGLLAFGALLWSVISSIVRSRREALRRGLTNCAGLIEALGIGLAGFLVASVFLHAAHPRFFWLLAGVAWALPRVVGAVGTTSESADRTEAAV